ncbi:MAG: hypothetical protein AB7U83_08640 [Vicinamibacterales bacterium]
MHAPERADGHPRLAIGPGRDGSNARIYKLAWGGDVPLTVIGGDGGLLDAPPVL